MIDGDGSTVESLIASGLGNSESTKSAYIEEEGKYAFYADNTEHGSWNIRIEQPRPLEAPATRKFEGDTGQQVTTFFSLSKGKKTFRMKHEGSQIFEPIVVNTDSFIKYPLGIEFGDYDGFKTVEILSDGIYILDVHASGDWTITIEE